MLDEKSGVRIRMLTAGEVLRLAQDPEHGLGEEHVYSTEHGLLVMLYDHENRHPHPVLAPYATLF